MEQKNKYYIGKIRKTHGIKGEVKVLNESDFERFIPDKIVFTEDGIKLKIESIRDQNELLIVKFFEYNTLEKSKSLQGKKLYTDEEPELNENEYQIKDLIKKECYTVDGEYIGVVKDVIFLPNQEILEILAKDKSRKMVPFIDEFIIEVSERIIIKPIEGLL